MTMLTMTPGLLATMLHSAAWPHSVVILLPIDVSNALALSGG